MNSLLPAGVSISAPTIDTSDSSKIVVFADVTANNAKDTGAVVAKEVATTTTDNNTNTSAAVSNAAGDNTAVVFAVAALAVAGVLGMAARKERAL